MYTQLTHTQYNRNYAEHRSSELEKNDNALHHRLRQTVTHSLALIRLYGAQNSPSYQISA